MTSGTIKFFNATKGFGFVTPDDGSADVFLPVAAVTGAGLKAIKPGQRITFEQAPDTKGPKVVSLTLVGDAPAAPAPAGDRVIVYCDASADVSADILEAVQSCGLAPAMRDYVAAPPDIEQLKRLSQMLSASGQGLVRRYDPLFLALRLDDRFITDQDFWTAIAEHPALINGPVLVVSGRARICKTEDDVRAFLRKDDAANLPKAKTLSPRIAAMLRGEVLPAASRDAAVESAPPPTPVPLPVLPARAIAAEKSKSGANPKDGAAATARAGKAPASRAKPKQVKPNKVEPKKTEPKKAKPKKTEPKKSAKPFKMAKPRSKK